MSRSQFFITFMVTLILKIYFYVFLFYLERFLCCSGVLGGAQSEAPSFTYTVLMSS